MFARWSFVTKAARRRGSVTERRGRRRFAPAVAALEGRNLLSVIGMAPGEDGKPVVVENTQILECIEQPSDVVIGVFQEPGVHLHLAGKYRLHLRINVIPCLNLRRTLR